MTCPADESLAAWAAGAVSDDERGSLEEHAADCAACRVFAVTMAGVAPHRAAPAEGVALHRAAPSAGAEGVALHHAAPSVGAEGATIGRYRVTGSVGHGAMGVVLRGHDPVLDREVAIKMVRDFAPADAERMLREAQTLARIDHAGVVRVYDAGLVGEEVFLAMEYVHGTTLRQWLPDRSLRERLAALVGVGEGLAAVHARGLVHRDIKPDNILVRESGRAVIVDFGLARPTGAGGATGSGIAGTPRYLAPEVLRGAPASAASDQFAWWTVVAETLEDLALPARRRRALAAAIERGQGAERFPTMEAAVAALERAFRRRSRLWIGVPAIAAIAVIAWPRAADPCAREVAPAWTRVREAIRANLAARGIDAPLVIAALDQRAKRTAQLGEEACRATDTRGLRRRLCLDESWAHVERLFPPLGDPDPVIARAALDELVDVLPVERCSGDAIPGAAAPPGPAIAREASALEDELRTVRLAGNPDPVKRVAALRAFGDRVRALGYIPIEIALHNDIAVALATTGDYAGARAELALVRQGAERAGDDDARARALANELVIAMQSGAGDVAALERDAEAAIERLGNPSLTARLRMSQAKASMARGELPAALAKARESKRLIDSVAIEAHAQQVSTAQNLAGFEQAAGDLAAAQRTYDAGYAIARRRFGESSPETVTMRGARATNLMYGGNPAAARPELIAVSAALEHALGDRDASFIQSLGYICEAELAVEPPAARASCARALALFERAFGATSPQLSWPLTLVGQERLAAGAPAEAIPPLERAVAITETGAFSPAEQSSARAYLAIALHRAKRDLARAARLAVAARAALRADPNLAETLRALDAELPPR